MFLVLPTIIQAEKEVAFADYLTNFFLFTSCIILVVSIKVIAIKTIHEVTHLIGKQNCQIINPITSPPLFAPLKFIFQSPLLSKNGRDNIELGKSPHVIGLIKSLSSETRLIKSPSR